MVIYQNILLVARVGTCLNVCAAVVFNALDINLSVSCHISVAV